MKALLVSIEQTIDTRVAATLSTHHDWPCRPGCDRCCRHLAAIPEITKPEWQRLWAATDELPESARAEVVQRMRGLRSATYPFTCPLLDPLSGRCLTYQQRPLACRTYGFYIERGVGLYCDRIGSAVESGDLNDVVWGNQAGVDEKSAGLGARRSLVDWFTLDSSDD
jgi:Fe-S-cluster containining protein